MKTEPFNENKRAHSEPAMGGVSQWQDDNDCTGNQSIADERIDEYLDRTEKILGRESNEGGLAKSALATLEFVLVTARKECFASLR